MQSPERPLGRAASRLKAQLQHLPRAWHLVFEASGGATALWLILLVTAGLLPALSVHLVRLLVDTLTAAARDGDWSPLLAPAAALGGVLLLIEVLAAWQRWLASVQAERVGDHLAEAIQRQALAVDLEHYDDSSFYDRLHRARAHAQQHPAALLESGGSLLQNGLTLLAMAAVLVPYGWWWPLVLVASTAPAVVAALASQLEDYDWRRRTTADRRRAWYFDHLMSTREAAPELRLLGLGSWLRASYRRLRLRLREERQKLARRRLIFEALAAALALAAAGLVLAVMTGRVVTGRATLGELALFAQAFYQGQRLMRSLLENVGNLYGHLFDIGDLFAFLDLDIAKEEPAFEAQDRATKVQDAANPGLRGSLRCRGVTYRYQAAGQHDPPALDGLDLDLGEGRIHAIVGPNGAGKSTLIKILAGLLAPQEGSVEIAGVDLQEIPKEHLWKSLAVMFQEPVRYQASALDNVRFGDLPRDPTRQEVEAAAEEAGAAALVESFEQGWDTPLGTWFAGGRELSVGQWQRLALARACLRRAPILLLDEPTSAMDVWSETTFFEHLRQLVTGRTVVLITHRPTAARHADLVHLLAEGRVRESGTHQDLLAQGGRYADMWLGGSTLEKS